MLLLRGTPLVYTRSIGNLMDFHIESSTQRVICWKTQSLRMFVTQLFQAEGGHIGGRHGTYAARGRSRVDAEAGRGAGLFLHPIIIFDQRLQVADTCCALDNKHRIISFRGICCVDNFNALNSVVFCWDLKRSTCFVSWVISIRTI